MGQLQILNFKHLYYKLQLHEFPTVRGKYSYNKFSIDELVEVRVDKKQFGTAILFGKEIVKLNDLSLEFMKLDGEYTGFVINTKQDYVDLLNSFLPEIYQKATLESEKTIFYFRNQI